MIKQLLNRNKQLNDIYKYQNIASANPLEYNMRKYEFTKVKLKILYLFLRFKENIEFLFHEKSNVLEAYVANIDTLFSINLYNTDLYNGDDAFRMKRELEEYKRIKLNMRVNNGKSKN